MKNLYPLFAFFIPPEIPAFAECEYFGKYSNFEILHLRQIFIFFYLLFDYYWCKLTPLCIFITLVFSMTNLIKNIYIFYEHICSNLSNKYSSNCKNCKIDSYFFYYLFILV